MNFTISSLCLVLSLLSMSVLTVTDSECGITRQTLNIRHLKCFKWYNTLESFYAPNIHLGRIASAREMPFVVLIAGYSYSRCTGALLNKRWVITAGHCIMQYSRQNWTFLETSVISVYVGLYDKQSIGRAKKIVAKRLVIHPNITVHPDLTINTIVRHDIALIELSEDVVIGREANHYSVNTVCLPNGSEDIGDQQVYGLISGWGSTNATKLDNPRFLMMAWTMFNEDKYYFLARRTPLDNGATSCSGDSGGPLIRYISDRAILFGILSRSSQFSKTKPCIGYEKLEKNHYVKIKNYINWIENEIH